VIDFLGVNITADTVMFAVLAFFVGLAGVIVYRRLAGILERSPQSTDDSVIEAVILEYTRRLRDYDRAIAELRTKVDIAELRVETRQDGVTSRGRVISQPPQYHAADITDITRQSSEPAEQDGIDNQNGTTSYILKMLGERPRTSHEVQDAIGRTREHTARLMKKLHESGLVERDTNAKPFKYRLTAAGLEVLRERSAVPSELRTA
jgi:CRP-like cAMP-binding protein